MKYVCLLVFFALLGLIVHDVTAESQPCSTIGQPCGSDAEYQCCDRLKCVFKDGDTRCGPWWAVDKSESNEVDGVKPEIDYWRPRPHSECFAYKADCQADPNNCCGDLTCVKDALSFWTCL